MKRAEREALAQEANQQVCMLPAHRKACNHESGITEIKSANVKVLGLACIKLRVHLAVYLVKGW